MVVRCQPEGRRGVPTSTVWVGESIVQATRLRCTDVGSSGDAGSENKGGSSLRGGRRVKGAEIGTPFSGRPFSCGAGSSFSHLHGIGPLPLLSKNASRE